MFMFIFMFIVITIMMFMVMFTVVWLSVMYTVMMSLRWLTILTDFAMCGFIFCRGKLSCLTCTLSCITLVVCQRSCTQIKAITTATTSSTSTIETT